jgi:transposase InsO family protein
MGDHHDADPSVSALDTAIGRVHPPAGLILSSDICSEFANAKLADGTVEAKVRLSMSSTENSYNNATAESFFAAVKLKATPDGTFASRQQARMGLLDYFEVYTTVSGYIRVEAMPIQSAAPHE